MNATELQTTTLENLQHDIDNKNHDDFLGPEEFLCRSCDYYRGYELAGVEDEPEQNGDEMGEQEGIA